MKVLETVLCYIPSALMLTVFRLLSALICGNHQALCWHFYSLLKMQHKAWWTVYNSILNFSAKGFFILYVYYPNRKRLDQKYLLIRRNCVLDLCLTNNLMVSEMGFEILWDRKPPPLKAFIQYIKLYTIVYILFDMSLKDLVPDSRIFPGPWPPQAYGHSFRCLYGEYRGNLIIDLKF